MNPSGITCTVQLKMRNNSLHGSVNSLWVPQEGKLQQHFYKQLEIVFLVTSIFSLGIWQFAQINGYFFPQKKD